MKRLWLPLVACSLASLALFGSAARAADSGNIGMGPRVGFTSNPSQVMIGWHYAAGQLAPHVRCQPNLELGFGDHQTLLELNADFHYRFQESWDIWNPYAGGGLGFSMDFVNGAGDHNDLQWHLIGGVERGISSGAFFGELKVGLSRYTPDWKVIAGWTFGRH